MEDDQFVIIGKFTDENNETFDVKLTREDILQLCLSKADEAGKLPRKTLRLEMSFGGIVGSCTVRPDEENTNDDGF